MADESAQVYVCFEIRDIDRMGCRFHGLLASSSGVPSDCFLRYRRFRSVRYQQRAVVRMSSSVLVQMRKTVADYGRPLAQSSLLVLTSRLS